MRYKNITEKAINIEGLQVSSNQIYNDLKTIKQKPSQEIKNLLNNKYIELIEEDDKQQS